MRSLDVDRLPLGTVTFLFTDIEGSTRLLAEAGEAYEALLEAHDRILRSAISGHRGVVVNTEGDAIFAVFHLAPDAVAAAAEAQHALDVERWPAGRAVRVRMGLHSGEGRRGGADYVGLDVHIAARVASAGHGGQILLSEATRSLAASGLPSDAKLRDLGPHRLKDIADPTQLYQLDLLGLRTEFPTIKTLDARPTNLSRSLTSFIGRDDDLEAVRELLNDRRLVTLTGPGGTGKTRLAQELGRELLDDYPDGVFFVDLSPISDVGHVPRAMATAMDLALDPQADALDVVKTHLRHRETLLIVDNLEHLIEAATAVAELLDFAPALRVMATSRQALRIYGEQEFRLPPLDLPDPDGPTSELLRSEGVTLFKERAMAVDPTFEITDENVNAVAGIVARLDGLPLAIELAASRVRVMGPQALESRMGERLPLLVGGSRGRPERQQTMRAAIGWSYELLEEPVQRLFARLSVFPGGFLLDTADAVADPGDLGRPVIDGLEALMERSLVRRSGTEDSEIRYGMLATILEYAGERLVEAFDADETHRRLAETMMRFAEECEPHLVREGDVDWLDRCERERPNLQVALRWAIDAKEATIGLRTASALWRFWHQRGPISEGRQVFDGLLALDTAPSDVRAHGLSGAGGLAWWGGDYGAAKRFYDEALVIRRQGDDEHALMEALYDLGFVTLWPRERRGPTAAPHDRPPASEGSAANETDADLAHALISESQAIAERIGDERGMAMAQEGLGLVTGVARRDPASAIPLLEDALRRLEEIGDRSEATTATISLANALRFAGQKKRARDTYLQGWERMRVAGIPTRGMIFFLAATESEIGRHRRAVVLRGAGEAYRDRVGMPIPPVGALLFGDPVAVARQALNDTEIEEALSEGRAMSTEEAFAYAYESE